MKPKAFARRYGAIHERSESKEDDVKWVGYDHAGIAATHPEN
jgi:hypothetical protein